MMPPYMSVKVRWTTTPGTMCPTLYKECVIFLTSHRFITCARACETWPTVYRPYPRRLESLTVCRCYYKAYGLPLSRPAQYSIELTGWRHQQL